MITNFKIYEKVNDENEPKIGDYVICSTDFTQEQKFIQNKIGKLIYIDIDNEYPYCIKYDDIPSRLYSTTVDEIRVLTYKKSNIIHWSKNKKDIELILIANKFNI